MEAPGKAKKAAVHTTGTGNRVMVKAEESVAKDKAPATKAITKNAADKGAASMASIAGTKADLAGLGLSRTLKAATGKQPKDGTMARLAARIRMRKRPATGAGGRARTAGAKASAASKALDRKARNATKAAATIPARANNRNE